MARARRKAPTDVEYFVMVEPFSETGAYRAGTVVQIRELSMWDHFRVENSPGTPPDTVFMVTGYPKSSGRVMPGREGMFVVCDALQPAEQKRWVIYDGPVDQDFGKLAMEKFGNAA